MPYARPLPLIPASSSEDPVPPPAPFKPEAFPYTPTTGTKVVGKGKNILRRIPPPAIWPPVLDQTTSGSTLHLDLKETKSSTGSALSLSKQVDELLARHRLTVNVSKAPARAQVGQQLRRPLPITPHCQPHPPVHPEETPKRSSKPHLYQCPASYGPSVSKIRSFPPYPEPKIPGLPTGAAALPISPLFPLSSQNDIYLPVNPRPTDTISRSFAKGGPSVFLHKGFFDLLSIAPVASKSGTGVETNDGWNGDRPDIPNQFHTHLVTPSPANVPVKPSIRPQALGGKRISVDMVGRPVGFTHLAHASDAEQAEAILTRWRIDGKGKLAEPAWAGAIKEQARIRARARAVAQVQANLEKERERLETAGPLKVVNGYASVTPTTPSASDKATDSLFSSFSNKAERGSDHPDALIINKPTTRDGREAVSICSPPRSPYDDGIVIHEEIPYQPILPPPRPEFLRSSTLPPFGTVIIRNRETLEAMDDVANAEEDDFQEIPSLSLPESSGDVQRICSSKKRVMVDGEPFKPSLETVERSVATKIYLENHYYGILKRPRDRDQRQAALEHELAAASMSDAQRRAIRAAWIASETEHLRDLRARVSPESFKKLKTIGHGAFGVVSLVKEKHTGELYAMKQLRKQDMLKKGQEGHVKAERDLLSQASANSHSHRWIVKLVYSFQDVDHLYLVMEFLGGGDLLNLLIAKDIFEEGFAKFYVAEMILAIQEAHRLGYIHRDIKPDNFIFGADGHIKLSDFGLATDFHWAHDGAYYDQQRRDLLRKHGIDLDEGTPLSGGRRTMTRQGGLDFSDNPLAGGGGNGGDSIDRPNKGILTWRDSNRKKLAYSVVGTNSYMSPEVIRGTGYDQSCDWWSLGVILFECLFGYPPFVSKSRHITRQKILTWRQSLKFPSKPKVTREAQDLIERLICEREDRLGSVRDPFTHRGLNACVRQQRRSEFAGPAPGGLRDGADDIKAHSWFHGIDFRTLHLKKPPFQPDLKDPTDTRYFDDDIEDAPLGEFVLYVEGHDVILRYMRKAAPDAQPGQADVAKDPILRDKVHGKHLLNVRKRLAFQGYTFKSPKHNVYDPRNGLLGLMANFRPSEDDRGRALAREPSSGFRRAMSL